MKNIRMFGAAVVLALTARAASAQLPDASAAGFGMAGNYTAVARGFDAPAFNPANLGLSQNPAFSLSLLAFGINTGIDPVKLGDVKPFGGKVVPAATKEAWLQQIGTGRERGGADAGLSILALSIRNIGLQVGLVGTGEVNLNQDAAEAILFGNAGRTGSARAFSFSNSSASGSAFGVGAVSLAIPISGVEQGQHLSFGVTGKYIVGLVAGRAMDNGSSVTPDNINVQFPVVYTDSLHVGSAGSGVGVDLGLAWGDQKTTFSVAAKNVLNTFAWSTDAFKSRPGGFTFDGTNSKSTFVEAPYSAAPASMRAALEDEKFKPEIAAGIAHKTGEFLLSADAGQRIGDGIALGPKMHVGVGAEFTGIPLLALRGGVAAITQGYQAAAGLGLHLGWFELGAGVMTRSRNNNGQEVGAMVSLVGIR
ncbi:MAG: hypothetical protein JWM95_776 [Gemmatimonadetes bacterium]|nr:hypothetical protein [Gemmatimonadota bacterium]